MNRHHFLRAATVLLAAATLGQAAWPQPAAWPTRAIKLVVPFPPGGGTDAVARAIGERLATRLGQPVLVDNKPGASTIIGAEAVTRAAPDGHTLLLSGSTTYSVNPALRAQLPYDPLRDLAPVAIVARTPLVLVVGADAPYRSVAALVAAARAQPRGIRYASFGAGSAPHLSGELFALAAGAQLQQVPYKGSAQSTLAVMSGEIEMGIDTVAAVAPHVQAGKLRALGIVGSTRASMLPGVPTLAEQGLPDAVFDGWYALAAPAGTPAPVLQRLHRELTAAMAEPALQQRLQSQGMEPVLLGAAEFRRVMESEIARYRALAHRAGIAPQ